MISQTLPTACQNGHTFRVSKASSARRCIAARVASAGVKAAKTTEDNPAPTRLRSLEELPYDAGLPFLGNILKVSEESFELATMFEEHNTDILNLNLGPQGWFLAIQSPEHMEEVFVAKGKDVFPKWPEPVENLILPQGKSLTNEEIRPWRVATGRILSQRTIMEQQMHLMVSEFTDTVKKWAATGEEFKWYDVSKRITFSAACRAAIGDVLSRKELDEMFPIASTVGQGVFSVDFGLKEGLPFTNYWRAVKAQKVLEDTLAARIKTLVEEERENLDNENPTVVREVLTALEEEGVDTSSSDGMCISTRLAKEVISLMFVGSDTTSYTISRCMIWLNKHPEWLKALGEEQQRLKAEYGEELDRKVYSRSAVAMAVAQEALRLTPPVKAMYRKSVKDMTIGDVAVPEGTGIFIAPRKAILETGNGKREFDPQQWLSEDRTECKVNDDYGNFVFGKGGRNCVGKHLAVIELVIFLAVLGREVSAVEMSKEEQQRSFFIIGDHPTGLPLKLVPRAP